VGFPVIQVDDVAEAVIADYWRYERSQRRLVELTVTNAAYTPRQFLACASGASASTPAPLDGPR
jgi:hypothetical protein